MAAALLALQSDRQPAQEQRQRPASAVSSRQPTRRGGEQRQQQRDLLQLQQRQQEQQQQKLQEQERQVSLQQEMERQRQKLKEMEKRRRMKSSRQKWAEPEQQQQQQYQYQELPASDYAQGYAADSPATYDLTGNQRWFGADESLSNDLSPSVGQRGDLYSNRNQYDVNWSSKPIVVGTAAPSQRYQLPPIPLLDQFIYQNNKS